MATRSDMTRVPPQNLDAEQSILGAMTLSRDAVIQVTQLIKPDHFYDKRNTVIYQTILSMVDDNEPVDYVTLTERLRQHKLVTKAGGISYVTGVMSAVPSAANVMYYAKIVHEKAVLRDLLTRAATIQELPFQDFEDLAEILDKAEKLIFEVSQKRGLSGIIGLKELIHETYDKIEEIYDRGDRRMITGVTSGFKDLDFATSGFQDSDLIILAARTSQGKTSFALNAAVNAAKGYEDIKGVPVAVFSLEMSRTQLALRMLCTEAEINFNNLKTGRLHGEDWPNLMRASSLLSELPIYIDDTPGQSIMQIKAKARRLKAEKDIQFIIIDYLQLMMPDSDFNNRQEAVAQMSRSLKALARELDIPVLALSQLSREADKRDGRPKLSDLRESGAIEQDADLVVFLYRKTVNREGSDESEPMDKGGIAQIIIAKHRNGPTTTLELFFRKQYMKFGNITRVAQAAPF